MRQIERQMLSAIHNRKDWKCDNTQVQVTYFAHGARMIDRISVFLHGNHIAQIEPNSVAVNACGWKTTTTKSRLNAILREFCNAGIYQKNKQWYGYDEQHEFTVDGDASYVFARV